MKKVFLTMTVAALCFAGCSKDESAPAAGDKQVRIDPTIVSRATEVDFEAGDRIGLTIAASEAELGSENNCLTFDGASGVFASDLKWFTKEGVSADLAAYYPYEEAGVPTTFAVKADQTAAADYTASDFMTAFKTGVEPTAAAVGMTFRHRMTKLLIKVNNTTGTKVAKVIVGNFYGTGTVDVAAGTVAAASDAGKIDAAANVVEADKTYRVLVVPQSAALTVTVEMADGKSMTQNQTMTELKSGGQYSVELEVADDSLDVTISGDIENWTDEGTIEPEPVVAFEEGETSFTYDGETYGFKTLADGNTWMTENLRYVPAGKTVSPTDFSENTGIWYPCETLFDGTAVTVNPKTDAETIAAQGYFYTIAVALGVPELNATNTKAFEGARGICPTGWHIPTVAEWIGLVGHCSDASMVDTSAPYYDATDKGAKLSVLNSAEVGFNIIPVSYVNGGTKYQNTVMNKTDKENYLYGYPSMGYYACSSGRSDKQMYAAMLSNMANKSTLSVGYNNLPNGISVRCVRDTAK